MDHLYAIRLIQDQAEAEQCARMMAESEPWLTLGRDYAASLSLVLNPLREVYVALAPETGKPGSVLGFTILNMQGAFIGYLQTICVAPAWRNRGVGSQLIAFAEQRIFRESPNVFLCVSSFNPVAQHLYERLGYEVIGTLKSFLVAEHDEILMRKSIGPLANFKKV